jgi:hypothetical protein
MFDAIGSVDVRVQFDDVTCTENIYVATGSGQR